ncbi:MAG: hypothetical protein ABFS38_13290 [Bacteroidota bacterium]
MNYFKILIFIVVSTSIIQSCNREATEDLVYLADLMSGFQQAPTSAGEDETWVPMELIHDYENGMVK